MDELKAVGLTDAAVDDNCYVTATLPASPGCEKVPVIAFISHMDPYPEVSGENVVPTFHEDYQGGDIALPQNGIVIKESENPYLKECLGETIITADGTTLLGADDKAGIAEIMEALTRIHENPDFAHGPIKIAFTPDEEVGQGVKHFDIEKFGALVAYTMDGGQRGEVEDDLGVDAFDHREQPLEVAHVAQPGDRRQVGDGRHGSRWRLPLEWPATAGTFLKRQRFGGSDRSHRAKR